MHRFISLVLALCAWHLLSCGQARAQDAPRAVPSGSTIGVLYVSTDMSPDEQESRTGELSKAIEKELRPSSLSLAYAKIHDDRFRLNTFVECKLSSLRVPGLSSLGLGTQDRADPIMRAFYEVQTGCRAFHNTTTVHIILIELSKERGITLIAGCPKDNNNSPQCRISNGSSGLIGQPELINKISGSCDLNFYGATIKLGFGNLVRPSPLSRATEDPAGLSWRRCADILDIKQHGDCQGDECILHLVPGQYRVDSTYMNYYDNNTLTVEVPRPSPGLTPPQFRLGPVHPHRRHWSGVGLILGGAVVALTAIPAWVFGHNSCLSPAPGLPTYQCAGESGSLALPGSLLALGGASMAAGVVLLAIP